MALEGVEYGVGAINRMGPGFFPAALGVLLMVFAVLLAPEALRAGTRPISFPMRPLVMIGLGLVAFAGLVVPAGLVPATLALVFVSAFAEVGMRPRRALLQLFRAGVNAARALLLPRAGAGAGTAARAMPPLTRALLAVCEARGVVPLCSFDRVEDAQVAAVL